MKKNYPIAIAAIFAAVFLLACPNDVVEDELDIEVTLTERQSERTLERFDANRTLESWSYDKDDKLVVYSLYEYDGSKPTQLNKVWIYSDDDPADTTTCILVAEYAYDDPNPNVIYATSGRLCVFNPGTGTYDTTAPLERFVATYDTNGNYTDMTYYQKDDAGAEQVEQHRVCSYDANGEYAVESYFSDAAGTDLLERYTATYDPSDTWKCVREVRYFKIPTADLSYTYERTLTYEYSWDANDNMYLQAEFDETGNMTGSILQTYEKLGENWYRATRGSLNQNGLNALYRTYEYDATNQDLIEIRYYNKSADAETELLARDSYKYFNRKDGSGNDLYFTENTYYVNEYSSRGAGARMPGHPSGAAMALPPAAHHLQD
jgi:hypothetical protein